MNYISETDMQATVARLQKEMNDKLQTEVIRLNSEIKKVQTLGTSSTTTNTGRPVIVNLTRNGDLRDSVDSRYNTVSAGDDSCSECACVYAYPPFEPILIEDAEITAASNVLKALTSTPFTLEMEGRYVIISGAGAGGEDFSAKIVTFNNTGEVVLSANAITTIADADARINLLKLTHKNTKNSPGDSINDALKDATHSEYLTNITDPDWKLSDGIGRLGGLNTVGFPFGYFSMDDGTTYIPLHQLFSGRIVFVRVNVAKANPFVKVKGRLYLGIYNNSEMVLDWVKGSKFTLTHQVLGSPATTVVAEYLVVIETDSGFSLVSEILTVPDAPDLAAFALGAKLKLNWSRFAGTVRTTVYRRLDGGNVFKLESDVFEREYTDVNNPTRTDQGASFPTVDNAQDSVAAFFATPENSLDELPDNSASEVWQPLEVFEPFPPSVNMATLFDPHLIMGLTEPLATEVTDAVADGAGNISSAAGAFTPEMVGKNYTLRHQPTNQEATGTVISFTSANEIGLSDSPFAESDCILEIEDSQPNGLLFDLVGTALTEVSSDWGFHPEDLMSKQPSVSNPEDGSSQGGIGGSDGYGGGTGGVVNCVLEEVMITVRGTSNYDLKKKRADEVLLSDSVWTGEGFADDDFNPVKWIKRVEVNEIIEISLETKKLPCTQHHRLVIDEPTKLTGIQVKNLMPGNNALISEIKSSRIETITEMTIKKGKFQVISFGLEGSNPRKCHLMVCNDVQSHNLKEERDFRTE